MGKRDTVLTIGALGIAALGVAAAVSQTPDPSLAREEASLKAVCGRCHNLQVVMNTPRSFDDWHETIQSMLDRGAKATDAQLDDVVDYLNRTMTTINVNNATQEDLEIVLAVQPAVAQAIIARRGQRLFADLADLAAVPGIDPAALNVRTRLIFFR